MKLEGVIYCGDNLYWMARLPDEFVDLCYIDPPFFSDLIKTPSLSPSGEGGLRGMGFYEVQSRYL